MTHPTQNNAHRIEFEMYDVGFESLMDAVVQNARRESPLSDIRLSLATGLIWDLWRSGNEGLAVDGLLQILAVEVRELNKRVTTE